jgi:GT2 family glycosyltransferase
MITIVYSTHKDQKYNQNFQEHLKKSVGVPDVQILEYINKNEFSLSQIYNRGISESIYDIVVCVHNDVKLEKGWGKKILEDFESNPDFGIIGKAGSCYFPESGVYWERLHQTMVGQVYHHPEGRQKWLSRYSPKLPFLIEVVTIDGLFISFNKTKIKHIFDESIGRFHFYDHLFCIPNYLDGVKIGVTSSFEIIHESVGMPNEEFFTTKELFVSKYKNNLPIDLKPTKIFVPEIKEKPIKNIGKVAVIIPNKNNTNLLIECINSFIEKCNSSLFDIFVADTGSDENELKVIKDHIKNITNIKLIEYDYYNFAKINNDVVKNHVDKNYEFILFCNNDIKLLNNVIYGMLKIFKSQPKVGTVGARLHFGDNTIQHDGVVSFFSKEKNLLTTHKGLGCYYNHSISSNEVIGNTAALMMIKKKLFEDLGGFNENYITCFEDVELNYNCLVNGYKNYCDGSLVSYHYESQTRNKNPHKMEDEKSDYYSRLIPFVESNMKKLKNYIREM